MKLKIILTVLLVGIIVFLYPHFALIKKDLKISLLKTFFSLNGIKKVNGQTNFLILGVPGGAHEGPNLTDSMIVANYNFKKGKLTTIGVPRDIWSDSLKDRINTAYAYGEAKKKGGGLTLARAEIARIIGLPIQYSAVINFSEFEELIDFLGGVEIEVENSFIDKKFPIEGKENDDCGGDDPEFLCRYETIEFNKGKRLMAGEIALKYVRSRNAEGDEGSDFARSKRQQAVMDAVQRKVGSKLLKFNVSQNRKLYELLDSAIERDFTNQQASVFFKNIILKGGLKQEIVALPQELFEIPDVSVYGKYVLVGKTGDFQKIQQYIDCKLAEKKNC